MKPWVFALSVWGMMIVGNVANMAIRGVTETRAIFLAIQLVDFVTWWVCWWFLKWFVREVKKIREEP